MANAVDDPTTRPDLASPWFRSLRVVRTPGFDGGHRRLPPPRTNRGQATSRAALLDGYMQGWAEANPLKIMLATDPDYQFIDPLIGVFSRTSLPRYFQMLRTKFAVAGVTRQREVAFSLRAYADVACDAPLCRFYREAPELGLAGIATVTVGNRGVTAETVAYDSNLALEILNRPLSDDDKAIPALSNVPAIAVQN